ncbi:MAG: choice-of-anchor D domain-containing protein [Candidatus Kapabacteria bacterium]|nr:choice-of-anchor D domain-containing protein [Candidatus Kapabacteria bacterium]MDW8012861.1 choice-of-anchor D domain-containing protein [Bacteroidota bacterium]
MVAALALLAGSHGFASERVELLGGREYWLSFPHSWIYPTETARGISALQLWVASREVATVQVYTNGGQVLYQQFQTQPKKTTVVAIPMDHMNVDAGVVADKGIRVVANKPIVVTGYVSFTISGEAFMCIPVEALGKRYYTLNLYQDCVGSEYRPAQILIIATRDNTVVRYYPTTETSDGTRAGQSKEIRLNRGQTYLIKAKIDARYNQDWRTDLTGTYIEASEPIAVISGHTKGSYPRYSCTMLGTPAHFMRNSLMDMMWPVELWGTMYVSAPIMYKNRPRNGVDIDDVGDLIRFVASEDGTIIEQLRQDGSQEWQQISPPLRRGQVFNITAQEHAAAYRSNKPVLVGQYGKAWRLAAVSPLPAKDEEEIQNPPRNGEGMLMCLTPRERWATYTTFYSPPGMDNFFMITFETDRMNDIYFDGVRLRNKFSGGIKPVRGTPYSYVVAIVPPGDHTIEGRNGAQFAAYAYGNLDLSKTGFAYGYPTGINYAIRCEDTVLIVDREECGNVRGQVEVRPLTAETECARIFSVALDSAVNYELVLPESFRPSYDRQTTFELRVVNPQEDAYARLEVIARSGKRVVKEYVYVAEAVAAEPTVVDFGIQAFERPVERSVVVRNPKPRQVVIKRLYLRANLEEFELVEPTNFPVVLQPAGQPGDRVTVRIRTTARVPEARVDSLYAELSCYPVPVAELRVRGSEPIMWVDDADFGNVPVGTERMRRVRIESRGQLPLEITAVEWADRTHFRTEGLLEALPLRLAPGQTYEFRVYYKPTVAGAEDRTRAVFTVNATKIKLHSDWRGTGIVANVAIEGYDWGGRRVADAYARLDDPNYGYRGRVVVSVTGNTTLDDVDVLVEPDPQSPGDVVAFHVDKTNLPRQLQPGAKVELVAYFKPTQERQYRARVVVRGYDNRELREAEDGLLGVGLQPHVDAEGRDFGTLMVGQSRQGVAPVYSRGSMVLTVRDLEIVGPDADAFRVEPAFLQQVRERGLEIQPGQSVQVPVVFTALRIGEHRANLRVISDAPETPEPELIGRGIAQGLAATDYDFGRHFVTTRVERQAAVYVRNTGSARVYVERIEKAEGDVGNFEVLTPPGFWIEPQSDYPVDVAFSPDAERRYQMRIRYVTNIGEAYSTVLGEGRRVYGLVRIGEYRAVPGTELELTVELTRHPNATLRSEDRDITDGRVQEFEVRVWYDDRMLEPVLDVAAIRMTGTLTEGWQVEYVRPLPKHVPPRGAEPMAAFQVKFTAKPDATPLRLEREVQPLFHFRARAFLAPLDQSWLPVEMVPLNRPYVVVDREPGLVRLTVPCVQNLRLVRLNPVGYSLQQVVPQPARGQVQIQYSIGYSGWVRLELFNAMGQRVAMLVDQPQEAGEYELTLDTQLFPAGVYYYRLSSGPYAETRQLHIVN